MIFQWGDNPDYTIETWHDFTNWKLPFGVNWRCWVVNKHKNLNLEIMFLCFGIKFDIWRKQNDNQT